MKKPELSVEIKNLIGNLVEENKWISNQEVCKKIDPENRVLTLGVPSVRREHVIRKFDEWYCKTISLVSEAEVLVELKKYLEYQLKEREEAIRAEQRVSARFCDVNAVIEKVKVKILWHVKLLKEIKWVPVRSGMSLTAVVKGQGEVLDKLRELLQDEYHCGVKIDEGVELRFDDSDVALVFDSDAVMDEFFKKSEIVVDCTDIDSDIDATEKRLASLRSLKERFKA